MNIFNPAFVVRVQTAHQESLHVDVCKTFVFKLWKELECCSKDSLIAMHFLFLSDIFIFVFFFFFAYNWLLFYFPRTEHKEGRQPGLEPKALMTFSIIPTSLFSKKC